MIQHSIKIVKSCVIWYIFRWAGGRVTRGGCVDGWVGGTYRRGNLRSKYHKNRIFDKIGFLTWFGLVLRSDSESA